jgi:hypothetical protein
MGTRNERRALRLCSVQAQSAVYSTPGPGTNGLSKKGCLAAFPPDHAALRASKQREANSVLPKHTFLQNEPKFIQAGVEIFEKRSHFSWWRHFTVFLFVRRCE